MGGGVKSYSYCAEVRVGWGFDNFYFGTAYKYFKVDTTNIYF